MAIKKVGIESTYSSYIELKDRNVVAQGWCNTGDLAFLTRANNLDKYIPIVADDEQKAYNAFRQLLRDIHTGDIILAFEGNTICGITEIPPDFVYLYEEDHDYANCIFPVNWVDWKDFCPDPKLSSQGGQGVKGIENCNLSVNEYIKKNWKSFVIYNNISVQPEKCSKKLANEKKKFENRIIESRRAFYMKQELEYIAEFTKLLKSNYNLILTGAPGTGKTYLAYEIAKALGDPSPGFVQFHPSYDYTDFVEGLRPQKDGSFLRVDGVFKSFCKDAVKDSLEFLTRPGAKFRTKTNNSPFTIVITDKDKIVIRKDQQDNLCDFSWKDINDAVKAGVEDYKDVMRMKGVTVYDFAYSAIAAIANSIRENIKSHVFIIDEINRGELSKIFGELFFAIDPGYRGEKKKINTQYQNLVSDEDDAFKQGFYIPSNVFIIGTMNDIDRSVESMDFAIRRRFAWREVTAEDRESILDELIPEYAPVAKHCMHELNNAIENTTGLSRAYHIGPAYFAKLSIYNGDIDKLWKYHLEGIIREYLRGTRGIDENVEKLHQVYSDNAKAKQ